MNTWAVFKSGGKQYKVKIGDTLSVDKLNSNDKDSTVFDQVLLTSTNGQIQIGKPYLEKVKIKAKIIKDFKEKKVRVVKFKSKSRYLRTHGHRQQKTKILIEEINA